MTLTDDEMCLCIADLQASLCINVEKKSLDNEGGHLATITHDPGEAR